MINSANLQALINHLKLLPSSRIYDYKFFSAYVGQSAIWLDGQGRRFDHDFIIRDMIKTSGKDQYINDTGIQALSSWLNVKGSAPFVILRNIHISYTHNFDHFSTFRVFYGVEEEEVTLGHIIEMLELLNKHGAEGIHDLFSQRLKELIDIYGGFKYDNLFPVSKLVGTIKLPLYVDKRMETSVKSDPGDFIALQPLPDR